MAVGCVVIVVIITIIAELENIRAMVYLSVSIQVPQLKYYEINTFKLCGNFMIVYKR